MLIRIHCIFSLNAHIYRQRNSPEGVSNLVKSEGLCIMDNIGCSEPPVSTSFELEQDRRR